MLDKSVAHDTTNADKSVAYYTTNIWQISRISHD